MLHKLVKKFENPAGPITLESEKVLESPSTSQSEEVWESPRLPETAETLGTEESQDYFTYGGFKNYSGMPILTAPKSGSIGDFMRYAYPRNYNIIRRAGIPKELAIVAATHMTMQQANESEYGRKMKKHNRGGFKLTDGSLLTFDSATHQDLVLYDKFTKYPNWNRALKSSNLLNYVYTLENPLKAGEHVYEGHGWQRYYNRINGGVSLRRMLNKYIGDNREKFTYQEPTHINLSEYTDVSDMGYMA